MTAPAAPRRSPRRVTERLEAKICRQRRAEKVGPDRLAIHLDVPASTIYRVLASATTSTGSRHLDRPTAAPIRRYERTRPGELVHVDVKKLGRIPRRRRPQGPRPGRHPRRPRRRERIGYAYLHTAIDDYSRLAYTEVLADETGPHRAPRSGAGPRPGSGPAASSSSASSPTTASATGAASSTTPWPRTGIIHKYCRPYRPQTNGKVERFHRTLLEEWAYVRPYAREADRTRALARWLHRYNHHRVHTAIGGPPTSRVTNLPREHI